MNPYYDHAGVTIYHGDAMEVLNTLDMTVNLVVTSPPYNQMSSLHTDWGNSFVSGWKEAGYPDEMPEGEYQEWQNALL